MFKTTNVGSLDRTLRIALGLVLIALPLVMASSVGENAALRWGMTLVGVVLVATAWMRFCPLYRLVGANTCRTS